VVFKKNKLLEANRPAGATDYGKIGKSAVQPGCALLPRNPHSPPAGGILFRKGKPHFYRMAASMERQKTIGLISG